MLDNFRKKVSQIIAPVKNSAFSQATKDLATDFFRHGNKKMYADWSNVVMSDAEFYTGYGYAAIRNRANLLATIAKDQVKTKSEKEGEIHPYLQLITTSRTFSVYNFWKNISTYLDLEGVYFLMAIRAKEGSKYGKVTEFKLLNPYRITRIMDKDGLKVGGYVESKNGMVREIPPEMIIEIRELNPFDEDKPYAMTDAAKESQFTIKTTGDYTRNSLNGNLQAPGILSIDKPLDDEQFKNFVARVRDHKRGEPIFGNGSGVITWENMQTDLSKAALKENIEVNRDTLFSVSGQSKTSMGIEQSGTTRETSNVQMAQNIQNHILPQIQLIIDALDLDYQNNYSNRNDMPKVSLYVDNPLATDHEAEIKDADAKTKQNELYQSLLNRGYDADIAASYVAGNIDITQLGEPTNPPKFTPPPTTEKTDEENHFHFHQHNKVEQSGVILQQQGSLQNAIVNIEDQVVSIMASRIKPKRSKNEVQPELEGLFNAEKNLITTKEKNELKDEMALVLVAFYGIIFNLEGNKVMKDRTLEFKLPGTFSLNKDSREYIKDISDKVSNSHIDTVVNDLYETAKKAALEGKSQQQIISVLTARYNEISESRAKAVARTETNRAFTRAQFDADREFINQNDLGKRAYKQWITRSDNPCEYCQALANEGPIPFSKNFRNLGSEITVGKGKDKRSMPVNFEALEAGNAHTNCSCAYILIIRD